ncbi:MAG: response regulator, partial [Labilithrix sp.]|nr:response regulator [Labilithrix sp.]
MGQKVLVFESDAAFAGELRNELTKLGCNVQVVDDGNTGLQQASSARPDLILLSIELPRMNGFSVCNKLKKDPALKDVPLIIMSSESSDETFEQHRKLRTRAEDYVHKPITFGDLLARIEPFVVLGGGSAPPAEEDHPTGHPPADAAEESDDILIEEMPSQAPSRRASSPPEANGEHVNGNGTASLDAALRAASEAPPPRISERPVHSSHPPPPEPVDTSAFERAIEEAQAKIRELELEISQAKKDNEDLKSRLTSSAGAKAGGVSSREFLDLREALNKKDKEILSFREQLSKKDKEIVDIRDKSLAFERLKADLDDKVLEQERELAERAEKIESLSADKEQAKKAGEDFKRRAERAQQESEARTAELTEHKEKSAAELAAKDAEIQTLREEHAQNLEIEKNTREKALAEAEAKRASDLE